MFCVRANHSKTAGLHFYNFQVLRLLSEFRIDKLKRGHDRANIAKRVMGLNGCCASSAYNHISRATDKMKAQKDLFSELV